MIGSPELNLEDRTAQALAELSRTTATDWDVSVRRIVQFDAERLRVERVNFWSLCQETSSIHCEAGYVASIQSFEHGATLFESNIPEYFAALREARTLNMSDVRNDPRCRGLRDYCSSRGIASMLDVPVWLEGHLYGVLCHEHVGTTRRWGPGDEDFVTSVGQVVSSALGARAHTEAEAAARRAGFLDAVSCALHSLDAREIANRALSLCVSRFADLSLTWVRNPEGALECFALKHRDPTKQARVVDYVARRHVTPHMAMRVLHQGQSFLVPDMTSTSLEQYGFTAANRAAMSDIGLRTGIVVPLSVAGQTFGAISFFRAHPGYDADDLALAESVASRVAAALEDARLYQVARESIHARDELLELAAHELRTPLTALHLRAQHQLRRAQRAGDTKETERSEHMARDVRRFTALIDHMLDALSIRAQGVSLAFAPCDLATIVGERVELFGASAQGNGSSIIVDAAPSVAGRWDRAGLEKVVDVLLDNAVKFGQGAPIEVSVRAGGTSAELVVRDHGMGISGDRLSALFHPFERAVPKEHFGGLGLGLYIAKAIVDAHGGSIGVTSRPDEGATFVVRLPLGVAM